MTQVYPSLLSCDFGRLLEEVKAVEAAGADGIHVDVMDGTFVPNITLGPPILEALKGKTKLPLDCHLMIMNADNHLEAFAKAGASGITVHVEACTHLQRTLSRIRELGCRPGVCLNPATPFESLEWVLDDVDLILCMTVNPGFGGQKLIPAALKKAGDLVGWLKTKSSRKIQVQIDGGVNATTAASARKLGIDILVAGSAVYGSKDYKSAISQLRG
jgi:ribulose-phosphate 3-epimerase